MFNKLKTLCRDEDGAVTVDWVVLTAAVVALAATAFTSIQHASGGMGVGLEEYLSNYEIE
ncbi:hypothetical protein [Marinibacterium sp. SX1]|uniref:hypothetical protein n=1 Tax=Marinibacterium sp. SX1 TaxID=3388424 RepID=UPI003D16A2F2